jgi:hypothetical protein
VEGRKRRCHVKRKKTEEDRRRGLISNLEEEDGKEQPDKFSPPFRKQFQATADMLLWCVMVSDVSISIYETH